MTDPLAQWWQHPIVLQRRTGTDAFGTDAYASPQPVNGWVQDGSELVTTADGQQITSTARIWLPAATANVPVGSLVTLPATFGSRKCEVIRSLRADGGALPTPDHLTLQVR